MAHTSAKKPTAPAMKSTAARTPAPKKAVRTASPAVRKAAPGRTPATGAREVSGVAAKPISQPIPTPAYVTKSYGLPPITLGDFAGAVAVSAAGAVISSVFITSLQGGWKWIGAGLGAGLGVLFTATSPMGAVSSELGMGMLSASAGWFWFHAMGKLKE